VDVSGSGANETRLIIRLPKHGVSFVARVMKGNISDEDLEEVADAVEDVIKEWNVQDYRTAIDAGGVGYGLPAIMRRRGYLVKAVQFGETKDEHGVRKIPAPS
jgi:MoaA/NifB/PqqE/SkfB family radical SAM enzyme